VSDDIDDLAERLRAMRVRSENATRRDEVLEAVHSKHEGIQSLALQVLGIWGGKSSVKVLREFLIGAVERKHGWSIRGVAVNALAPWIVASDAKWLLDLYFALPGVVAKHEVLPLVRRLPIEAARAVLVARLRDSDAVNRQAAVKAIGGMPFPDRADLLRPLCVDPDKDVRASARLLGR
jgi:HEAT repeat protein